MYFNRNVDVGSRESVNEATYGTLTMYQALWQTLCPHLILISREEFDY